MKTLDEIINNAPYEKLNNALIERSMELANKIRQAMEMIEIKEIGDYSINTVEALCGYRDTSLYIKSRDRLKFLNDAKSLLEEMDSIAQKRMEEMEKLLEETKNL